MICWLRLTLQPVLKKRVKYCQTEITNDCTGLEMENTSFKEKLKLNSLNEESFREDNDKVLFIPGYQIGKFGYVCLT